jgi:hypothetical protein
VDTETLLATLGTSAVVSALVSGGIAILTQRRQQRHEREQALRLEMLEAARQLMTVTGGVLTGYPSGLAVGVPVTPKDLARGIRTALTDSAKSVPEARLALSGVVLFYGPDSDTVREAEALIDGLNRVNETHHAFAEALENLANALENPLPPGATMQEVNAPLPAARDEANAALQAGRIQQQKLARAARREAFSADIAREVTRGDVAAVRAAPIHDVDASAVTAELERRLRPPG